MSSADPFVRGRPRLLTARMLVAIPLHSYTTHAAGGKDRFPKPHELSRAVLHHSLDLHLNIIRLLAAQAQTVKHSREDMPSHQAQASSVQSGRSAESSAREEKLWV